MVLANPTHITPPVPCRVPDLYQLTFSTPPVPSSCWIPEPLFLFSLFPGAHQHSFFTPPGTLFFLDPWTLSAYILRYIYSLLLFLPGPVEAASHAETTVLQLVQAAIIRFQVLVVKKRDNNRKRTQIVYVPRRDRIAATSASSHHPIPGACGKEETKNNRNRTQIVYVPRRDHSAATGAGGHHPIPGACGKE